jgi:hypothetical protein
MAGPGRDRPGHPAHREQLPNRPRIVLIIGEIPELGVFVGVLR